MGIVVLSFRIARLSKASCAVAETCKDCRSGVVARSFWTAAVLLRNIGTSIQYAGFTKLPFCEFLPTGHNRAARRPPKIGESQRWKKRNASSLAFPNLWGYAATG